MQSLSNQSQRQVIPQEYVRVLRKIAADRREYTNDELFELVDKVRQDKYDKAFPPVPAATISGRPKAPRWKVLLLLGWN